MILWASKSLDHFWESDPAADAIWHSPSLVDLPPDAPRRSSAFGVEPRPMWFYRVCPAFGAWVHRAITRADATGANISDCERRGYHLVREYLENAFVGCWARVVALAASSPVAIPGAEIIAASINHARYGFCPKWDGWEKDAARFDAASGETPETSSRLTSEPAAAVPRRAATPKRSATSAKSKSARADVGAGLFG